MIKRKEYSDAFYELFNSKEVSLVNIYGERGIGKTAIGMQLREDEKLNREMYCGFLDCGQFSGMTGSIMMEVLYELCGVLASMRMPAPLRFHIADSIDSKRYKRISYLNQQKMPGIGLAIEVQDFVDSFVEIPYISAGLKTAQLMSNLYRRYRPKNEMEKMLFAEYSSLGDVELHEKLPEILAEDISRPVHPKSSDKRGVIFLENCDTLLTAADRLPEWLEELIKRTPGILWVVFSRKRLEGMGTALPIHPMKWEEADLYLLQELLVKKEATRKRVFEKSAGIPFYMQRIAALLEEVGELAEEDWADIGAWMDSSGSFARDTLGSLPESRREILIQLTFAKSFDEDLFKRLFPGRLLGLYRAWFDNTLSLFTKDPAGYYCVQHSMREEIQRFICMENPELALACLENLFTAEGQWLRYYARASQLVDSKRHLEYLCIYGKELADAERCFYELMSLKEPIFLIGGMLPFCSLLELLTEKLKVPQSRVQAYKELAAIDFCCGRYENAWKSTNTGIALAQEAGDVGAELQFLCIQMNLSHISANPWAGEEGAVRQEIILGRNYHRRAAGAGLSYKAKAACTVTADLFLARAYIARREWMEAQKCLDEIFVLCKNPARRNALQLYGAYGEAMELQGVLYSEGGEKRKALEAYQEAVEAYQMGEIFLEQWDAEFYLNYGLAYKRIAERHFGFGEIQEAVQALELALLQYQTVQERMPDMIDTFCKIGFAYTEGVSRLWENPAWDQVTEEYLSQAERTVEEAVQVMEAATGKPTWGNRQLCNIRCTTRRLAGLFYSRKGDMARAEKFFRRSVEDGEISIEVASDHAYSYMEYAKSCLEYARFTREKEICGEYAEKGIRAIEKARVYMGDANSFSELFIALKGLL
ncbi:hypothetical protein D5278_05600 [bacterium 1XD21-13]|nr:hypothetical protein [bacterium 1XD21-13]